MANKKASAKERREFVEKQRAQGASWGSGHKPAFPRDMSFIDRSGRIVHPKGYESAKGKRHYRIGNEERGYDGSLANMALGILGIAGVLGGLFFLSSDITGNVVGISQDSSSGIGVLFFLIGLISAFFYINKN